MKPARKTGGPWAVLLTAVFVTQMLPSSSAIAATAPLPTITISALDAHASEKGPDPATFLLKRTGGAMHNAIVVAVVLSGTAKPGADYVAPPALVRFDRNVATAKFVVTPVADALKEGAETVTLEIDPTNYYLIGEPGRGTITIADAAGGGSGQGKPTPTDPGAPAEPGSPGTEPTQQDGTPIGRRATKEQLMNFPPGVRRSGTLHVTMTFDGTGHWSSEHSGANTTTIAHRKIEYSVPLEGMYGFGSGFHEIDKREEQNGIVLPVPNRFLVLRPRIGSAGSPCGRGHVEFKDVSRGMAIGDPGMTPLVPFKREIRGGGNYPTRDKTVPERDLCQTALTIDFAKQVIHLRLDGSDTHVKVKDIYDGREVGTYNRVLHGRDGGQAKNKLTFFDWPLPDRDAPEGYRVIQNFIMEQGPEDSKYPLTAKVQWKLTMDQHGW